MVAVLAAAAVRDRERVLRLARYLKESAREFFVEHVQTPAREIIDELVFNRRTRITDVRELADSKESLRRMLEQFMLDTRKDVPPAEVCEATDVWRTRRTQHRTHFLPATLVAS